MSIATAINRLSRMNGYMPLAPDAPELERRIDAEIRRGLKTEREGGRLGACRKATDYYELRGTNYIPRREAESAADYARRPKRHFPFTRRTIDILTSKLYSPGPSRKLDDTAADEFMQGVWRDLQINSLMQKADRLATLHGICAVQVAATGDDRRPIRYNLWGRDQFVPYPDPQDATKIAYVVTVDAQDEQTRYTWWSAGFIRTYVTRKQEHGPNGTITEQAPKPEGDEPNPYGVLPFAFIHHEIPTNHYEACGLGEYLSSTNQTIDIEASDMLQAVQAYHTPWAFVYDAESDWNPIKKMGSFIRINTSALGFERGTPARVEFAQPTLDIEGGWSNVRNAIATALEGVGVPESLYRLNESTLPSGAAQVAEQQPLIDYSEQRREPFKRWETELAKVTLQVAGSWVGDDSLLAAADDVQLSLTWPPTTIRTPGQEQDQQDQSSMSMGMESLIMVTQRRMCFQSRDQSLAHLQQVADDRAETIAMGLEQDPNAIMAGQQPPGEQPDPEDDPEQPEDPEDETGGDE